MNRLHMTAGGALLVALALAPRAEATDVLSAPDAVRACLCRNQSVAALASALNTQRQQYTDQKQALDKLDQQANDAKQHLNPDNLADREALGRLLNARDSAQDQFASTTTPRYNASVKRYDDAVSAFNDTCAGKAYDPTTLAQVRPSLACPPSAAVIDPVLKQS